MILAVDVHYEDDSATAAGVLFQSWESDEPESETVLRVRSTSEYVPGQFYLRELPCILSLIEDLGRPFSCIIIDGYVFLGEERKPGLGMHLWELLERNVPVIGVAKSAFHGTPEDAKVFRGGSRRPLFVTSTGIPLEEAKDSIRRMNGEHRIPTLLKRVDVLCRKD